MYIQFTSSVYRGIMLQNRQPHLKILAPFAARFLKCISDHFGKLCIKGLMYAKFDFWVVSKAVSKWNVTILLRKWKFKIPFMYLIHMHAWYAVCDTRKIQNVWINQMPINKNYRCFATHRYVFSLSIIRMHTD